MAEEKQIPQQKAVKATFVDDSSLPVPYVNIVSIRAGLDDFFVTLGTVLPPEVANIEDLEAINSLKAQPIFRFAVSRSVLKQVIDVMQTVYDQQTKQLEMTGIPKEED